MRRFRPDAGTARHGDGARRRDESGEPRITDGRRALRPPSRGRRLQVALSLVLVVGAVLFVRSLRNLMTLDPGFRQDGLLLVSLDFRHAAIPAARQSALPSKTPIGCAASPA